jgi:hypothetical protein
MSRGFQAYQPSPDPEHRTHLEAALALFARGTSDCIAGLTTNTGELTTKSTEELHAGRSEFLLAKARLNTISGNWGVPMILDRDSR